MLTHGWVRTVRTAQNLHNADIQWAERAVEADFVEPKLCIAGRLNQNCGHGVSIRIVCDGSRTSVGSPRRFDDIAPAHRRTPKCAVGRRSRSGLIVRSSVRHRSVGPHAWSRARVDRLAPRKEPRPSGEGSLLPLALRAGVALSHPKKAGMLGPGGCSGWSLVFAHKTFEGPRMSALNSRH